VYDIRPLAATHLREALEAATNGQGPKAIAALMAIDADSWVGLENRLNILGTNLAAVLATATAAGATDTPGRP
jgi:hypothetical protein